jgi:hypothetical protein
VGAAYLRQASTLLTGTILPQAVHLYATEANRLGDDYGTGTATASLVVLILVVCVALALLAVAQLYISRVSRRILNVPMLAATVALGAVSIWAVVGLIGEQNALATARHESDAVELLSASRVLLARAQGDQSLTLVNRGSDETDPADFAAVMRRLAPNGGLLGEASALTSSGSSIDSNRLAVEFASYQAETARTTRLVSIGRTLGAIRQASSPASARITDRLNADLAAQFTAAQARFTSAADDAASWLAGLSVAIPVVTVLAAGLALIGVRERLTEYR